MNNGKQGKISWIAQDFLKFRNAIEFQVKKYLLNRSRQMKKKSIKMYIFIENRSCDASMEKKYKWPFHLAPLKRPQQKHLKWHR